MCTGALLLVPSLLLLAWQAAVKRLPTMTRYSRIVDVARTCTNTWQRQIICAQVLCFQVLSEIQVFWIKQGRKEQFCNLLSSAHVCALFVSKSEGRKVPTKLVNCVRFLRMFLWIPCNRFSCDTTIAIAVLCKGHFHIENSSRISKTIRRRTRRRFRTTQGQED